MAGVNKVILLGRLGKDPEIKYTSDGVAVTNFSIATSKEWTDRDSGEKKANTEWHRIVAWRRLGEICNEYLSKGRQVYIEGRLETRSWEQDGVTRYMTEIIATEVQFVGNRNVNDESNIEEQRTESVKNNTYSQTTYGNTDEDIPF